MGCFTVPLGAALILFGVRKLGGKDNRPLRLLNLLLASGSIMLVIDHWWNQELFYFGETLASDLFLGILMTLGTTVFWGILLQTGKLKAKNINPSTGS